MGHYASELGCYDDDERIETAESNPHCNHKKLIVSIKDKLQSIKSGKVYYSANPLDMANERISSMEIELQVLIEELSCQIGEERSQNGISDD